MHTHVYSDITDPVAYSVFYCIAHTHGATVRQPRIKTNLPVHRFAHSLSLLRDLWIKRQHVVFLETHQMLVLMWTSHSVLPLVRLSPEPVFCVALWRRHVASPSEITYYFLGWLMLTILTSWRFQPVLYEYRRTIIIFGHRPSSCTMCIKSIKLCTSTATITMHHWIQKREMSHTVVAVNHYLF